MKKILFGVLLGLGSFASMGMLRLASDWFSSVRTPSSGPPRVYGSYARGCLAGAFRLPETGPFWQTVRTSRNRSWGHPSLLFFIERLGARVEKEGRPRLLVSDLSQSRGGPVPGAHRSHQIGLDVDIWFRIPGKKLLSLEEREKIMSVSVVSLDGTRVSSAWGPTHMALIRLAAEDVMVERIFVHVAIKKELCRVSSPSDVYWLRKVRPWRGHSSHMHVRLACPENFEGGEECVSQMPPPFGDGCGKNFLLFYPRGETDFTKELTLDDLPSFCSDLVLETKD